MELSRSTLPPRRRYCGLTLRDALVAATLFLLACLLLVAVVRRDARTRSRATADPWRDRPPSPCERMPCEVLPTGAVRTYVSPTRWYEWYPAAGGPLP
jgi:hypothetical protein